MKNRQKKQKDRDREIGEEVRDTERKDVRERREREREGERKREKERKRVTEKGKLSCYCTT